ncbi:MAG TPA: TIGR01777 family oxidoreductase [Planctomycetaceae bacterium]|nr:TIGR01777 family oxidoreductase [Planctomycetaceae bacterium]
MPALQHIEFRTPLPVSAAEAFAWHEQPGALERLTPPWEAVQVVQRGQSLQPGERVTVRVRIGPAWVDWVAEHRRYVPGVEFQDVLISGPFAAFEHTHRMEANDAESCTLVDAIDYRLPAGLLGRLLADGAIRAKLTRMFRYRHAVTTADLALSAAHRGESPMKVLITGATGLVGKSLIPLLTTSGHETYRLVRTAPSGPNDIPWNPDQGEIRAAPLEGLDAVVHLAGENIAGARWSAAVKRRLRDSRIQTTKLLCETLAGLTNKPKTLVCASAIGYYGDRGSAELTEASPAGEGFLADLCRDWEASCEPARQAGIRVVNLRIGVVLSPQGGALSKMLLPFQLGGGGVLGSGSQYWSWIAIDDLVGAIHHCLLRDDVVGPVNATAPEPATNREFTKTLGAVLHRPTILPMPAFAARLALGEMADALLLSSARVLPRRLMETGYEFRCPTLESALKHVLGR